MGRVLRALTLILAVTTASGCTLKKTDAPPLSGPSELSLAISLVAIPDVLTQDGESQSQLTVQARDANGQPARISLRAEITVNGLIADFGTLSAKTVATDGNGRAFLTYTAPPFVGDPVDNRTIVTILVTPSGTDFRNATSRSIDIRLVPPGVILPPNGVPKAAFTFSPTNPIAFTNVQFDASGSQDPDGTLVLFDWAFGDGGTGSGMRVAHQYKLNGQYTVTLKVTDDRGLNASISASVTIGTSTKPTASFTFSPTAPIVGQNVFFNGSASTAPGGRTIVKYEWNFGGGGAQGVTVTRVFDQPGTYNVTLIVTDDVGQTGTTSQPVTVSTTGGISPVASFTFSPSAPVVGTVVSFNGSASTSPSGITNYEWDFGDNSAPSSGPNAVVTHSYLSAGSFVARLTVRDGANRTATTTQTILVGGGPIANFTFSPTNPTVTTPVTFNASTSSSPAGILTYTWDFGDNTVIQTFNHPTMTVTHAFSSAPPATTTTYTVTLTVKDGNNVAATISKTVPVTGASAPPPATPPTANFVFSPTTPVCNTSVNFNASSSTSAVGIATYTWDFGDASMTPPSSATPSHTYACGVSGTTTTYVVTLTVTDTNGLTATISKNVPVSTP